jgi:hypothetical protein
MIIGVALKLENGTVLHLLKPARHCHFSAKYNEEGRKNGWDFPWKGWEGEILIHAKQGFVDENLNFLDRKTAAIYALRCGQIDKPKSTLFSEDLW